MEIAKNFNLIGGELITEDSTKLPARNSKKTITTIKSTETPRLHKQKNWKHTTP
jgi:hypothetical protein